MQTRQLWLDLTPKGGAWRADNFVEGFSNALARKALDAWPQWPGGVLALSGPAGCGKTHLAHVWAKQSGAQFVTPDSLPRQARGPLVVDALPDHMDETALFRLINDAAAGKVQALLIARQPPRLWPARLPDLKSRLCAMHRVEIEEPDDAVLAGVLKKLFADRQIVPDPPVIPYLLSRMERSTAAALEIVEHLHALGHDQRRNVRLPLARTVMTQIMEKAPPPPDLFDQLGDVSPAKTGAAHGQN